MRHRCIGEVVSVNGSAYHECPIDLSVTCDKRVRFLKLNASQNVVSHFNVDKMNISYVQGDDSVSEIHVARIVDKSGGDEWVLPVRICQV